METNGRKRVVAKKVFHEYCDSSTIHGLKYLGTRPMHEKIWWIAVFSVSLSVCGFQIRTIWNKWDQNPVIVNFNENLITISEINFPAITICHQNRAKKTMFNYSAIYQNIMMKGLSYTETKFSREEMQLFELIAQTCIKDGDQNEMRILVKDFVDKRTHINPLLLEKVAPKINETLVFCASVLEEREWECARGFGKILTEEGLCYTFNLLNKTEILRKEVEFNYDENFPPTAANWSFEMASIKPENPNFVFTNPFYPFRVFTTGQQLIVYLASNTADDFDIFCPGYGGAFRVYVHAPNELPWYFHQYHDINIRTYTTLSVEPQIVMATERMKTSYAPERRKCYFDGEKRLKYFKHYTKRNCELECLINVTQAICNCSRFNFPRDSDGKICGLRDYECMTRTATFYLNVESASATLNLTKAYQGRFKCNCWASCRSVQYAAVKREEKLFHNQHKQIQEKEISANGSVKITEMNYEMTKLYVTFKDSEFFAMKRSELYGLTDFIANCGGLLGLFMGVSLLSLVEIIYFFTVRFIMGIINRHKKINIADTDEDMENE